ncbi:MAG: prepilin-type N-terminal cleavage/methylation domain-containing protein [candidate division WOR-3 bacterium]
MRKGMTLIEIMVSLVILMIVLGAIYSILTLQQERASVVSETSVLQTDAQVAYTLFKWDLMLSGLCHPKNNLVLTSFNNTGYLGSDAINLRGVSFGFEMNQTRWGYMLEEGNGTQLVISRFPDTTTYFKPGDQIIVLSDNREIIDPPGVVTVTQVDTFTYYDENGNPKPAQRVTVNLPVYTKNVQVVTTYNNPDIYNTGILYQVVNGRLQRGTEILLDNVENIQFAYGLDTDEDTIIDAWFNTIPDSLLRPRPYDRRWALRYTMVVASRPISNYKYPYTSVTVEDNTYMLTEQMRTRKRTMLSGILYPQNLEPY